VGVLWGEQEHEERFRHLHGAQAGAGARMKARSVVVVVANLSLGAADRAAARAAGRGYAADHPRQEPGPPLQRRPRCRQDRQRAVCAAARQIRRLRGVSAGGPGRGSQSLSPSPLCPLPVPPRPRRSPRSCTPAERGGGSGGLCTAAHPLLSPPQDRVPDRRGSGGVC